MNRQLENFSDILLRKWSFNRVFKCATVVSAVCPHFSPCKIQFSQLHSKITLKHVCFTFSATQLSTLLSTMSPIACCLYGDYFYPLELLNFVVNPIIYTPGASKTTDKVCTSTSESHGAQTLEIPCDVIYTTTSSVKEEYLRKQ